VPRISLEIVSCGGLRRSAASCGHLMDPTAVVIKSVDSPLVNQNIKQEAELSLG